MATFDRSFAKRFKNERKTTTNLLQCGVLTRWEGLERSLMILSYMVDFKRSGGEGGIDTPIGEWEVSSR
jgi:hypothetical protein